MFFRKKQKDTDPVELYNVGIFTAEDVSDDTYTDWTDQLMDAAENVGTTEHIMLEGYDPGQLKILSERFPKVNLNDNFFLLNVIDYDAIREETKQLEREQKWKAFFNRIPLEEYMDAEDRVVLDASKTLLCTNNLQEAIRFLVKQARD
ncbi:hypothetical protein [Sporosarcina cascadiensis]|uniref:hypothetical protein n=1 Tax=Sporosarcina cascadiensis TaxID=2660747 RepID=UPI00129B1397|nr:hypothetical protein [Sporosarcina cascadiensis]